MTREEAIGHIKDVICENNTIKPNIVVFEQEKEALYMAIESLKQEPFDIETYCKEHFVVMVDKDLWDKAEKALKQEPYFWEKCPYYEPDIMFDEKDEYDMGKCTYKQEPKTGHCKDCKYFEYDSVANVDGIPLIVAHEICSKWGDGCKTKEDGYCFLFEPQERSDKE